MPSSTLLATLPARCRILISRAQYQTCRIRVPDLEQPLSALQMGNEYYSFYKVLPDAERLLHLIYRLGGRSDLLALTQTPRGGYTIWVWEPEGRRVAGGVLSDPSGVEHTSGSGDSGELGGANRPPALCRILSPLSDYFPCNIYVPGVRHPRLALRLGEQYFSLFKREESFDRSLQVAGRLSRQGTETLLVTSQGIIDKVAQHLDDRSRQSIDQGYVVCAREPVACLADLPT